MTKHHQMFMNNQSINILRLWKSAVNFIYWFVIMSVLVTINSYELLANFSTL